MSYVSAILFFFIIWVSQFVTSFERNVSFEQHAQLQKELGEFIEGYVKQQLPGVTEFKMHSIYTKPPKKGKLRAYFNYSFKDSSKETLTELDGFATLQKIKDQPQQEWSLDGIEISGEKVTFDEPLVITSGMGAQESNTPAEPDAPKGTPTLPSETPKATH